MLVETFAGTSILRHFPYRKISQNIVPASNFKNKVLVVVEIAAQPVQLISVDSSCR